MWDLVPWPGIELRPPALGAWSLNPWTTREVPVWQFLRTVCLPVYPECNNLIHISIIEDTHHQKTLTISAFQEPVAASLGSQGSGKVKNIILGWTDSTAGKAVLGLAGAAAIAAACRRVLNPWCGSDVPTFSQLLRSRSQGPWSYPSPSERWYFPIFTPSVPSPGLTGFKVQPPVGFSLTDLPGAALVGRGGSR